MIDEVGELYDYDRLRRRSAAAIFVPRIRRATLVLGGHQSREVVSSAPGTVFDLRRRRGGGGAVLLRPGDLWVDWWLPSGDPRWSSDVRVSSLRVGEWWATALTRVTSRPVELYRGPFESGGASFDACFAGRGPGEVFVGGLKAVGITQWRVREGVFLSTVLLARDGLDITKILRLDPSGEPVHFDVATLAGLGLGDGEELLGHVTDLSGPWPAGPNTPEI